MEPLNSQANLQSTHCESSTMVPVINFCTCENIPNESASVQTSPLLEEMISNSDVGQSSRRIK